MPTIKVYIDPRHEARWYGEDETSSPTPETVPAQGADHKQE